MPIKDFRELKVWQKAHQLVLEIYKITKTFPADERFGLITQMRRAAVSIPANIAEGFRKRGLKDKAHFYNIAEGSLEEVRYYLILGKDLNYCSNIVILWGLSEEISRMLTNLIASLKEK